MKLSDIKAGDIVIADDGFTCMNSGHCLVKQDEKGLFIRCDEGNHYLDGQENENGELIGITKA